MINLVSFIIFYFLIFFCFKLKVINAYRQSFYNIVNESRGVTIPLNHSIERISNFSFLTKQTNINSSSEINIADFTINNNTRDAFLVYVQSQSGGYLVPDSTLDGESNIPFKLVIKISSGQLGDGMTLNQEITLNELDENNTSNILYKEADSVQNPTQASFSIFLDVIDDNKINQMAGSYSDILTLTFTDL